MKCEESVEGFLKEKEGSAVDLLLIFQDKFSLEGGWRKITETTAKKHMFVQVVAMTVDELKLSSLLSVALREGKTLFSTDGFSLQGLAILSRMRWSLMI